MVVCKYLFLSLTFLLLGVITGNTAYGQRKYESERRINAADVPQSASNFIDSLQVKRKIKWYVEEGIDSRTLEAKFRFDRRKYSVEFDTKGGFQDAEIQVNLHRIRTLTRNLIQAKLHDECLKYKIQKVQVQYSGSRQAVLHKIRTGQSTDRYTTKYELIVRCKSANGVSLFEYLFSDIGQLLTKRRIIFKNSSNLEY